MVVAIKQQLLLEQACWKH